MEKRLNVTPMLHQMLHQMLHFFAEHQRVTPKCYNVTPLSIIFQYVTIKNKNSQQV